MPERVSSAETGVARRDAVLDSAIQVFVRFGYRKTSMDDVARAAGLSRQGLYFLFDSKPVLFREAVERALERDLVVIAEVLEDGRPLQVRLLAAFERWAGSFIGPLTEQTMGTRDFDPALLGPVLDTAPRRFRDLITRAITDEHPTDAADRASTLISASIGVKHQTSSRELYAQSIEIAIDLIVGPRRARGAAQ
ncbi:TetR/AcrR family transcriptional regulator [Curtobacterium sp. ISL-83]|uniref:TetR/AcrR family transcriptional regulator n=1 Tax=Curtobacterium sp. ISL-83 TaxID=2819145 RepID=UPI001BEB6C99|nr:TetR/AcrR family transcriptional regulator [Curtobacterium sp. ISL-83]MBT2501297.1 TetR/AcrR family transcriptional regulator [Curtobacterium sp. ISL-83]